MVFRSIISGNIGGFPAAIRERVSPAGGGSGYFCHINGDRSGFADMGESARDLMIQDKFIAAQQSCELRQYLDGAAADASIGDIVDSCRVWESHTDAGYDRCGRLNPDLRQTISLVTFNQVC